MKKRKISNLELAYKIRQFTAAAIGTGYAFAIDRNLEALRPPQNEEIEISEAEAASIAAMVIARVEDDAIQESVREIEKIARVPGCLENNERETIHRFAKHLTGED